MLKTVINTLLLCALYSLSGEQASAHMRDGRTLDTRARKQSALSLEGPQPTLPTLGWRTCGGAAPIAPMKKHAMQVMKPATAIRMMTLK